MNFSTRIFAFFFIGSTLMSGLAYADESAPAVTVKFNDLNLNSSAGAGLLYVRIHHAAQKVCGSLADSRQLGVQEQFQKCLRSAEEGAIRRVNLPALAAYYQVKTGRLVASMALNVRGKGTSLEEG